MTSSHSSIILALTAQWIQLAQLEDLSLRPTNPPGSLPDSALDAIVTHHIPLAMADAGQTPEDPRRVPLILESQKPRVVGAPEGGLPVWFGRVGLVHVRPGIGRQVPQGLDLDFA